MSDIERVVIDPIALKQMALRIYSKILEERTEVDSNLTEHNMSMTVHPTLKQIYEQLIADHNIDLEVHQDIRETISTLEAMLEGRIPGQTFASKAELDEWLAIPSNTENLPFGYMFLITDPNESDYRWDGTQAIIAKIGSVDLENYYTKTQEDIWRVSHIGTLAAPNNPGHITIPPLDGIEYSIKDGNYIKSTGGAQKISGDTYIEATTDDESREVNLSLTETVIETLDKVNEEMYTSQEVDERIADEIRDIFIGNANHEYFTMTKSNVAANDEIIIPKEYDPHYKSAVIGVQEFINGEIKTEIGREYNNSAKDSFQPNDYITFDDGLSLINSKLIHMEPLMALDDITIFKTTIDLTEFKKIAIV